MKIFQKLFLFIIIQLLISLPTKGIDKIKHHLISAGIGLVSAQKVAYHLFSANFDYFKMKSTSLYHMKYAYQFKVRTNIYFGIGINYALFAYNNIYVHRNKFSNPNLSNDTVRLKFQSSSILLRGNANFEIEKNLILYIGLGIGKRTQNVSNASVSYIDSLGKYIVEVGKSIDNPMPIGFETTLGCNYYFFKNLGAYWEVGLAKSMIQMGIIFRF